MQLSNVRGSRGVGSNSTRRELQLIHTNTWSLTQKTGFPKRTCGTSLAIQWLRLRSQHRGCSSAAGWGTKSPPATLYDHPPPVKKRAPVTKKKYAKSHISRNIISQTSALLPFLIILCCGRPFLGIVGCSAAWLAPTP